MKNESPCFGKPSQWQMLHQVFSKQRDLRHRVERFEQAASERIGLPTLDLWCLVVLTRQALLPSEIADELRLARGTISPSLARLQQAGLIARRTNENDARSVVLSLTSLGENELQILNKFLHAEFNDEMTQV